MTRHDRVIANLRRHGALKTVARICERSGLAMEDVLGLSRRARLVRARHECWSVIHGTLGLSLQETADLFEVKDHTSVLSALRKRERALFLSRNTEPMAGANMPQPSHQCH